MSTHSYIGIENEDGTVTFVYCQFDGYPDHNGKMLLANYNTEEMVRKLISGGDMSSLAESCEKPEGHSFENRIEGHTVYYHRDRGEDFKDVKPRTMPYSDAINKMSQEYNYLFRPSKKQKWIYSYCDYEWKNLTQKACGIKKKKTA